MPNDSTLTPFGIRCRELRTSAGFVIADQAEQMGIGASEISKIEQGILPVTAEYLASFCYWIRAGTDTRIELEKSAFAKPGRPVFPGMDRKKTVATIRRFKQIGTFKPALIRGLSRYLNSGFDNVRSSDSRTKPARGP